MDCDHRDNKSGASAPSKTSPGTTNKRDAYSSRETAPVPIVAARNRSTTGAEPPAAPANTCAVAAAPKR